MGDGAYLGSSAWLPGGPQTIHHRQAPWRNKSAPAPAHQRSETNVPNPQHPREPWNVRVARWRAAGKTPGHIAEDAYSIICQYGATADDLCLTLPEREALRRWTAECERRKHNTARAAESRAAERAIEPAAPQRKSLRNGMSPTAVREALGCTLTELNRWSTDGRLPADGEKLYLGVGPMGGNKWGRAWLPATVEAAKANLVVWRQQDTTRKIFRRRSLRVVP